MVKENVNAFGKIEKKHARTHKTSSTHKNTHVTHISLVVERH